MASIADFIQLCMCRGKAIVRNSRYAGAVHQNVRIIGNTFQKYGGVCISAKATDKITVNGNCFEKEKKIKTVNCKRVVTEQNTVLNKLF